MENYFGYLINTQKEHILKVLSQFGYSNVIPTPEILLRAYDMHGEKFLAELYRKELSSFGDDEQSLQGTPATNWLNLMNSVASGGKGQGTDEQTDWGLTDDAKSIEEKKNFWERTKAIWDKALPGINAGTGFLNLLDKNLINKQQSDIDTTQPDEPKAEKNNTVWYIVAGVGLLAVTALVLWLVFRNKNS